MQAPTPTDSPTDTHPHPHPHSVSVSVSHPPSPAPAPSSPPPPPPPPLPPSSSSRSLARSRLPPPSYSQIASARAASASASPHKHQHHRHGLRNHDSPQLPPLAATRSSDSLGSTSTLADRGNGTTLPSLSSITGDMSFHPRLPPPHWSATYNPPSHRSPAPSSSNNTNPNSISNSNANSNANSSYRPSPVYTPDSPAATPMNMNMDMDMDMDGAPGLARASSPERIYEGTPVPSSVTLDDPDVRLAAEALGDLRADFVSSPPAFPHITNGPVPAYGPRSRQPSRPRSPKPEPLLSLLTTSHPLVASTLGGASSVYGGAKNYSPRFKSGAEYVEGYLTPLAKTVNSVGRATGVEGGVRWFLGANRRRPTGPTSDPALAGSTKRRRTGSRGSDSLASPDLAALDDLAAFALPRTPRRLSSASTMDSLPAYDDLRSPAYTEVAATSAHQKPQMKQHQHQQHQQHQRWPSRLITSTSGLSIAMSAESLRSLKYCLRWLRWANDHLNHIILMLKHALEEYEKASEKPHPRSRDGGEADDGDHDAADTDPADGNKGQRMHVDRDGSGSEEGGGATPEQSRTEIAARINSLKDDVLKTLQDVINNVSKYAGGALPENARVLVRRHLTSLPKRFLLATMSDKKNNNGSDSGSSSGQGEPALEEGAQKMLVLAKEGLDIVAQVSGVLDGTIVSAEQWCESMGRKRQGDDDDDDQELDGREPQDVKMG